LWYDKRDFLEASIEVKEEDMTLFDTLNEE
jgi:hypothetical protein